jgi:hypothetical protein
VLWIFRLLLKLRYLYVFLIKLKLVQKRNIIQIEIFIFWQNWYILVYFIPFIEILIVLASAKFAVYWRLIGLTLLNLLLLISIKFIVFTPIRNKLVLSSFDILKLQLRLKVITINIFVYNLLGIKLFNWRRDYILFFLNRILFDLKIRVAIILLVFAIFKREAELLLLLLLMWVVFLWHYEQILFNCVFIWNQALDIVNDL